MILAPAAMAFLEFAVATASVIIGAVGVLLGIKEVAGLRIGRTSKTNAVGDKVSRGERARLREEYGRVYEAVRRQRPERLSPSETKRLRALIEQLNEVAAGAPASRPTIAFMVEPTSSAQVVSVEGPVLQEPIRLPGVGETHTEFAS